MVGRIGGRAGAVFIAGVVLSACGDDDDGRSAGTDQDDVTSTSPALGIDGEDSDDHRWSSGSADFELDGERWEFALELCATEPNDPDTDTETLRVDGTALDDPGTTLRIVETVTNEDPLEIQVVSVSFEDADGTLLRTWEAQRVVDPQTGEVDDMHGDGTVPLLEVDEGEELVVSVTDAVFWQFDMTEGEDDRTVGTGDLRATCTP